MIREKHYISMLSTNMEKPSGKPFVSDMWPVSLTRLMWCNLIVGHTEVIITVVSPYNMYLLVLLPYYLDS